MRDKFAAITLCGSSVAWWADLSGTETKRSPRQKSADEQHEQLRNFNHVSVSLTETKNSCASTHLHSSEPVGDVAALAQGLELLQLKQLQ
jgi:hypothetical protein